MTTVAGPLPLTKTLDPIDYDHLATELALVDRHFTHRSPQHEARRWEYSLALRAWSRWQALAPQRTRSWSTLDVGGAGSPFPWMLVDDAATLCTIVDPAASPMVAADGIAVLDQALEHTSFDPYSQDAIFSLSVFEHLEAPLAVLKLMHRLLVPGGLLFLTFDYTETEGPDEFHFHWMRRRLYNPHTWTELYKQARGIGFRFFGGHDWTPHGPQVYDYSFASLCLIKGASADGR